jgi:hypothetical protein
MPARTAKLRCIAFVLGAAALLAACERVASPTPLLGTWYSEDERFAGRSLEIHPQWIRFMEGRTELGAIRIDAVTQEGEASGPLRFEIEGFDRDGQDTTLVFELVRRPVELLHLETQREPWRRGPRFPDPGGSP